MADKIASDVSYILESVKDYALLDRLLSRYPDVTWSRVKISGKNPLAMAYALSKVSDIGGVKKSRYEILSILATAQFQSPPSAFKDVHHLYASAFEKVWKTFKDSSSAHELSTALFLSLKSSTTVPADLVPLMDHVFITHKTNFKLQEFPFSVLSAWRTHSKHKNDVDAWITIQKNERVLAELKHTWETVFNVIDTAGVVPPSMIKILTGARYTPENAKTLMAGVVPSRLCNYVTGFPDKIKNNTSLFSLSALSVFRFMLDEMHKNTQKGVLQSDLRNLTSYMNDVEKSTLLTLFIHELAFQPSAPVQTSSGGQFKGWSTNFHQQAVEKIKNLEVYIQVLADEVKPESFPRAITRESYAWMSHKEASNEFYLIREMENDSNILNVLHGAGKIPPYMEGFWAVTCDMLGVSHPYAYRKIPAYVDDYYLPDFQKRFNEIAKTKRLKNRLQEAIPKKRMCETTRKARKM